MSGHNEKLAYLFSIMDANNNHLASMEENDGDEW